MTTLGTLARLIAAGQIKLSEKGDLRLFDERAVIIYFTILEGMLDSLRDVFGEEEGSRLAYSIAKEGSKRYIRNVITKLGYKGEKAIDFAGDMASVGGWGKITVTSFNSQKKHATIVIEGSPFRVEGIAKHPICHFSRGMFAGSASVIWGEDMDCVEVHCSAVGDEFCEFVLERHGELRGKMARKQLPLEGS